jgi:hypothetical protein
MQFSAVYQFLVLLLSGSQELLQVLCKPQLTNWGSHEQRAKKQTISSTGGDSECSETTCNEWQIRERNRIASVSPRASYAAAPLRLETNVREGEESSSYDQFLVIHGGYRYVWKPSSFTEPVVFNTLLFFDLGSHTWINPTIEENDDIPSMYGHTAASFPHIRGIVFYGGVEDFQTTYEKNCGGTVWILATNENQNLMHLTWKRGNPGPPRCLHTTVALGADMVVFGGCTDYEFELFCPNASNSIDIYDVNTDTWRTVNAKGHKPPLIFGHSAVAINRECMFIAAGVISFLGQPTVNKDAYIYNVSSNMWKILSPNPSIISLLNSRGLFSQGVALFIDKKIRSACDAMVERSSWILARSLQFQSERRYYTRRMD